MTINNDFYTRSERVICDGRHSNSELECNRLLALHSKSGKPDDMAVVQLLQCLAQALEGQEKYAEGLDTRLRVRDILISLMASS